MARGRRARVRRGRRKLLDVGLPARGQQGARGAQPVVLVAFFVAIEVKALLIGQSADPELKAGINAFLEQRPEIARLFNVITLQLGPDVMVAIKAEMRGDLRARELVEAINAIESEL